MNYPESMDQKPESEGRREDTHRKFLKQRNLENIRRVIAGELTAEQLAEQIVDREIELEERADHDGLTGLLNFSGFIDALTQHLEIIHQNSIPTYLAFLDIDKLKEFNDSWGKINGNLLIQTDALVLNQKSNQFPHCTFLLGRFGGDEFVALMVGASNEEALKFVEDIRKDIPEAVRQKFKDPTLERTVSIGIVKVRINDTTVTLLERADQALYKAKEQRNKVVFSESFF